jgi:hypothetical protein
LTTFEVAVGATAFDVEVEVVDPLLLRKHLR